MERDFMGLNSKEEAIEAVLSKGVAGQWSLSNGYEALHNRHSGENQKSMGENGVPQEPVQLTIFYRGMVNVYNDMSPEKAQAIMLLAGNGSKTQAQVGTPRTTPAGDGVHVSQPMNNPLPSPVSGGDSPGTGSTTATDSPNVMNSLRRVMQSAVPQMRGASLARFLEKRRERVMMASAPYNLNKSSLDSSSKSATGAAGNNDKK
uniref:protein TIFY 7-like n=1 Tax=Erigeron canadensis TaxID=72917 RepID=UPI001CB8B85E|nr:protein TIFY 7-like [Erigeron canadensis]